MIDNICPILSSIYIGIGKTYLKYTHRIIVILFPECPRMVNSVFPFTLMSKEFNAR